MTISGKAFKEESFALEDQNQGNYYFKSPHSHTVPNFA